MPNSVDTQKLKNCLFDLRERYHLSVKECHELAAFVLEISVNEIPFVSQQELSSDEIKRLSTCAARLAQHEPLAYVLGFAEFYGCRLRVNSDVLIPRSETELLVEKIIKSYPEDSVINVLDLCAGSGCIGLALKKQRPLWNVYLTDVSQKALEIAKENAHANSLKVTLFQGDLFEPVKECKHFFDLIVSNPPYISEKEYLSLHPSVFHYEPKLALTPGVSGLEIYARIAEEAMQFLSSKGRVALEIGYNQKEDVTKLFSNDFYKNILCEKDFAFHDRFIFLELQ